MKSFFGGLIGGLVGGYFGVLAYGYMKESGALPFVPKKYYLKAVLVNGNGVQLTQYLQADYANFGAIETAVELTKSNADQVLAVLKQQYPNTELNLEQVGANTPVNGFY